MPTIVRYNNVEIYNCHIRDFRQEMVYDDSGTDLLYTRFSITVEGILGAHDAPPGAWMFDPEGGGIVSRPHTQRRLEDMFIALREPRRRLQVIVRTHRLVGGQWQIDDRTVLDIQPAQAYIDNRYAFRDFRNGPQPQELRVLSIMGHRLCTISWRVESVVLHYPSDEYQRKAVEELCALPSPTVISNRWALEESFDSNFAITRTIRGCLVSTKPVVKIPPERQGHVQEGPLKELRGPFCWPPLEPGFRRESARFAVREDGLRLEYEIVDRQTKDAAPWPATTMHITHRRRVQDGATAIAGVQITLTGPPVVPRFMLVRRAVQLANFFLEFKQKASQYGTAFIIRDCEIVEEFGLESRVSLNMEIESLPTDSQGIQNFIQSHIFKAGREIQGIEDGVEDIPQLPVPGGQQTRFVYPFGDRLYHPAISWKGDPYGFTQVPFPDVRDWTLIRMFMCYLQHPFGCDHGFPEGEELPPWFQARKPQSDAPETVAETPGRPDFPVEAIVYKADDFDPYENLWPEQIRGRYAPDSGLGMYTYTRIQDIYRYDTGRHALRLSDAGPVSAIVVGVGATACYREIRYDCERVGSLPELPSVRDFQTQVTLPGGDRYTIRGWLIGKPTFRYYPPVLSPTGDAYIYRMSMRARWVLDRAPPQGVPLPVIVRPYLVPPGEQQAYGGLPLVFSERIGPVLA